MISGVILSLILNLDLLGFIVRSELLMDFVASADEQKQAMYHGL